MDGFTAHGDDATNALITSLLERDSDSTLIQRVGYNVRIHRYSHALFLHGVEEPGDPNKGDKEKDDMIKKVKEMFGMNAKINSA